MKKQSVEEYVEEGLSLPASCDEVFRDREIVSFDYNNDTLILSIILWKTERGVEGIYTLGYACCDADITVQLDFCGKDKEFIISWISSFEKKYHDKDSVLRVFGDILKETPQSNLTPDGEEIPEEETPEETPVTKKSSGAYNYKTFRSPETLSEFLNENNIEQEDIVQLIMTSDCIILLYIERDEVALTCIKADSKEMDLNDYCKGAEGFVEWLLNDSNYSACMIDTDDNCIVCDVGLTEDNYVSDKEDLMKEFKKIQEVKLTIFMRKKD